MRTTSAKNSHSRVALKHIFRGNPSAVAMFFALLLGFIGGSIPLFSPLWFCWLIFFACIRLNILLAVIAFASALLLRSLLLSFYISGGNFILTSAPIFWTNLFAHPGIRLLNLHHAEIIGPLAVSCLFSFIPAVILARFISSHLSHSSS